MRRATVGSQVRDDLFQILDAVLGEGGHGLVRAAADVYAPVFRVHVDRQVVEPILSSSPSNLAT